MIVSAQDLTRTRICIAARCPNDAEPSSDLCYRCARRANLQLHQTPLVYTGPTLPCCSCRQFKPDEAFSHGKKKERRGRNQECRECSKARRELIRALMTPEEHAAECARQAALRRLSRARRTTEQLEARRAQAREYDRARRAARTPEEAEAYNAARRAARALA